jgi:hypothetical protein
MSSGQKAFITLAIIAAVGFLGTTSAAWSKFDIYDRNHQGTFVIPCSLDGINPVWHSDIFGNPAVARAYGFIQSKDGSWHVEKNCVRGLYPHN